MKIFITGATGFIGIHLVRQLIGLGHELVCAVRPNSDKSSLPDKPEQISFVPIADDQTVLNAMRGCEIVCHLAGQMGSYTCAYEQYYETNCLLTKRLLDLSERAGVKQFIYCSTPGVYGFGKRRCQETAPYAPRNDYEKTKVLAEEIVVEFTRTSKMKYTIVRPDFVYGPGDTRRIKMYASIRDKKFALTTNGKSYLHPTYIDDIIYGIILCMGNENAMNEAFNIAAETDVTSLDYLQTIAKHVGSKLVRIRIGYFLSSVAGSAIDGLSKAIRHKEGFVSKNKIDFLAMDHSCDISKAKEMLGYEPKYDCDRGIAETIKWCKENKYL